MKQRETATAELAEVVAELRAAGCVAAEEEAEDLVMASGGDPVVLASLVARRAVGEPFAWVVGSVRFCGETVLVHPGVYVPRWQSEPLALEALARLPERGLAVDLCTGSGAIAALLARRRPTARVLACDIDQLAVVCARANGVEVVASDLAAGLPPDIAGEVDVVVSVVPYVPSGELHLLPRDVRDYEPWRALDGGPEGTDLLVRAADQAVSLLRPGGSLLLELGGDQADRLAPALAAAGYRDLEVACDAEGDPRAVYCRR